ncbi:hypothetical protein KJ877_05570 [bacterium]|nr:hypothetical protein [bacterium]MBU1990501.1 hypothetical protein [bacterium]
MPKKVDVCLIALSSPIMIGIYEDKKLIETLLSEEKSSDVLPCLFDDIFKKYSVENLFYANGPGSFMAIKVAYIFLKSISILKKIPLFATDAFYFNNNKPIKAIGKLYFVKISSEIKTEKLNEILEMNFELPDLLKYSDFSKTADPLYGIGAV